MIAELPQNISVTESGGLPQDEALKRVAQNHFFVLPTMNENFGYACIESLAVGCPNITSDNTAWSDLEEKNAGWRVPLEDTDQWVEKIKLCLSMDQNEYSRIAEAAANFAREWLERSDTEAATDQLLRTALSDGETPITPVPGELTEHTV
jgi:glycosyltransferase involved in cell wall biosynthesis